MVELLPTAWPLRRKIVTPPLNESDGNKVVPLILTVLLERLAKNHPSCEATKEEEVEAELNVPDAKRFVASTPIFRLSEPIKTLLDNLIVAINLFQLLSSYFTP